MQYVGAGEFVWAQYFEITHEASPRRRSHFPLGLEYEASLGMMEDLCIAALMWDA